MLAHARTRAAAIRQTAPPTYRWARLSAVASLALLAGCSGFSPDGGMGAVQAIAGSELGKDVAALRTPDDAEAAASSVRRLLKRPLTAEAAVQIALLNNRELQAAYSELGISEAALVKASLPPNPTFSVSDIAGGGAFEFERAIVVDILALATLPARAEIAGDRFHEAQLKAALATLQVAAQTRQAFYRAVAARTLARFLEDAAASAETAAQLSRRLGESGALNKLDQARDQVFSADLAAETAGARRRVVAAREDLVRRIGVSGGDLDFRLPNALPPLPGRPRALANVEAEAVGRRVDLQMARIEAEVLAKSYGLTNATRFIDLLDAGGAAKTAREPGGSSYTERGGGVEFQVPLFDFGEVRVHEAEATYMQAVNRLVAGAVNVRSQAREAYQAYRSAYDIAQHYRRDVLPLRKIISDEMLLRYNAMQVDVFALLAEARQRIASNTAAIAADRDFWLADTDLRAAIAGGIGAPAAETSTPALAAAPAAGRN
jgi:outer membrane protein TolC